MKVTVIVEQERYATNNLGPPKAYAYASGTNGPNLLKSRRCKSVEQVKEIVAAELHRLLPDQDVHIIWDFRKPKPSHVKGDPGKGGVLA